MSTYAVEDKTQVAELDPTMFLETAEDDGEDQQCQACGEDDNDDVLMFCDGCQKLWHTYCVGLQRVPSGHWFCENCRVQRDVEPRLSAQHRSSTGSRRRTRGQQRRNRQIQIAQDQNWDHVWAHVHSALDLDLDFPYQDDETEATSAAYIRRHRQRSIIDDRVDPTAWQRRQRIAVLQGAGDRFREPTYRPPVALVQGRHRRPSPEPEPQDPEAMLAWDAFDQARAASSTPSSSRKRKRKSRTTSPVAPQPEAQPRIIKRRRTSHSTGPVPDATHTSRPHSSSRPPSRPRSSGIGRSLAVEGNGPSFLQSLLQEVADSSTPGPSSSISRPFARNAASPTDHGSPRPSSPAGSPPPSNHSSPRATSATPPPPAHLRPGSPSLLSSTIQPIFPSAAYSSSRSNSPPYREKLNCNHMPTRSSQARAASSTTTPLAQPKPRSRIPHILTQGSSPPASTADEMSPTRATMSLSAKSDVQKLVSAALKPHYTDQKISRDQYTAINKNISRMLYDKIGDFEMLDDTDRSRWEKVAGDEVQKALGAMKASA